MASRKMETPMTPAASSAPSTMTCNMYELQMMRSLIVLIYTLIIEKLVIERNCDEEQERKPRKEKTEGRLSGGRTAA